MSQNIGPEGSQGSGVPPNANGNATSGSQSNKRKNNPNMGVPLPPKQGSLSNAQPGLGDMDPENVPAQMKREGGDWFAMYVVKIALTFLYFGQNTLFSRDFLFNFYLASTLKYRARLMSN
jgi:hypothetical protein